MHRLSARRLLLLPLVCAVALTALTALAGTADAAGLVFPENGTRNLGRAGAVVAQGGDVSMLGINPAQLAKLRGWQFDLQINIHQAPSSFTCTGLPSCANLDGSRATSVSNTGGIKIGNLGPVIGATTNFGLRKWTFGFAAMAPPGVGNKAYPATGPQRYDLIAVDFRVLQFMLGAAFAPIPQLRFGATFIWSYASIETQVAAKFVTGRTNGRPDFLPGDVQTTLAAKQAISPGGEIGLAWDALPFLELAASVRLPTYFNLKGTAEITQVTPDGQRTPQELSDNSISFKTNIPPIAKFGVRYKHLMAAPEGEKRRTRFDIELDFVYEPWHLHDSFGIDFNPNARLVAINAGVPPISKLEGFQDAWNIRLGSDINIVPDLFTFRLGAFYEKAAIPLALKQVGFFSDDQVGVSGGVSFFVKGFEIFASYMHIFIPDRVVSPGIADGRRNEVSTNPAVTLSRSEARAVNAGLYQASYNLFGVGVRAVLDDILRARRGQ